MTPPVTSGGAPAAHAGAIVPAGAAPLSGQPGGAPPDVTAGQVADVLDRARQRIEQVGWWDGSTWRWRRPHPTECPVIAIAAVTRDAFQAERLAMDAIRRETDCESIPHWNDAADAETVLLTLKLAAERVRREGLP